MQRVEDDTLLQPRLIGFARLMAQWKIDKHRAGRFDSPGYVDRGSHTQGWNPGFFNYSRYQSDGLVAYGSGGHQVEGVNFGAFEFIGDFRGEFGAHFARGIDAAHEAEAWVVQLADHFLPLELL
jgi:hypothetical protein